MKVEKSEQAAPENESKKADWKNMDEKEDRTYHECDVGKVF